MNRKSDCGSVRWITTVSGPLASIEAMFPSRPLRGLTMPRGREFAATDGADGAEAAIVNDRFAAQYWPGEDPIGKKIQLGPSPWITVVGVSPTIRQTSLRRDVEAIAYVPFRQSSPFWFRLIARAREFAQECSRCPCRWSFTRSSFPKPRISR